jgi:uncharacterized membrane protein YhhN
VTGTATVLFALTVAVGAVNWWAVAAPARRRAELAAKPATLLLLIGAASVLDPADPTVRAWFVAALVFSLAGDVFLLFAERFFVFGLGAFLVGHLAYVAGFVAGGDLDGAGLAAGLALVAVGMATLGRRIVGAVRAAEAALAAPVAAYMVVISAMVVVAFGTLDARAMVGAVLFYASDALIAWNRFIQPYPWARVAIMVTYHLGQIGLVLSLV